MTGFVKLFNLSDSIVPSFWAGWRRPVLLFFCFAAILFLGAIRTEDDAVFFIASLALLPVLVIGWIGGRRIGLSSSFLASTMWAIGDVSMGRHFSAPWIPWANVATHFMTYSIVTLLAAQVRELLELSHRQATSDALTELQNRRAFVEAGVAEVQRSMRYAHPLAVIFMDLDNFKALNDSQGHDAGDAALRATAAALLSVLRSSDKIARIGGDEFAVLLPEIGSDAAQETGQKISIAVNQALSGFASVSVSIGLVWFEKADRSFPEMLKIADELMYEIKANGKGGIRSRYIEPVTKLELLSI